MDFWTLFHFVFYRVRHGVPLDDRASPDNQLALSAFNPSRVNAREVLMETNECPGSLEVRLLSIRPRSRGERLSLRTFPVVTLHPRFPFNV